MAKSDASSNTSSTDSGPVTYRVVADREFALGNGTRKAGTVIGRVQGDEKKVVEGDPREMRNALLNPDFITIEQE